MNSERNQKVIVLDVDGVLLKFTPAFDVAAGKYLNREITPPKNNLGITPYDLCARINGTMKEVDEILQYMLDEGYYENLEELPGARDAVDKIKKAGFKIVVCTALPDTAKDMRLKNLKEVLDLEPDEIYCVGMGMSKKQALAEIKPDVYVDDRIKYLNEASSVNYLVWCDQYEQQDDLDMAVTTHVNSLGDWVKNHMPAVSKELDNYYQNKNALQLKFKFETARIRHKM